MSANIRTRPTTKEFRDNWEATFGKKKKKREFCVYCGAGLGEHRREGEGTCPKCDLSMMPSAYDDKFADLRHKMQLDADAEAEAEVAEDVADYERLLTAHLQRGDQYKAEVIRLTALLKDHIGHEVGAYVWERFIDRLDKRDGVRTTNFLGSIDAYKEVFMAVFDDATD